MEKLLKQVLSLYESEVEEKEEIEQEKEDIESERDTHYYEKEEIEQEKENILNKLNYHIYEDAYKQYTLLYGNRDLFPCPQWFGDIITSVIGVYESLKTSLINMNDKYNQQIKENNILEKENEYVKETISKINPRFNEDITFNGDCTENIDELTKLIKLQNKLMNNSIYDITVNADKERLSELDFTWADIDGIYVHDWDDPDYTYTGNNTFNGFLEFLDIKEYGVNNNRAIKLLCENSSIFEGEKAFGMAITLKKDKDKKCGMVYLTSWNMYSEN